MVAMPVTAQTRRRALELSREEARDLRIRLGLELSQQEIDLRRKQLCRKPEPKYAVGFAFTAYLKTSAGEMVSRQCKVVSHQYSFSLHWGQTLRYELEGGAQVLQEQIERAMNPSLARPRYLDYCEDCDISKDVMK